MRMGTANHKAGDINSVYGVCENQEQFQVLRFTMKLKCVGGGRLLFHLSASLLFIDCQAGRTILTVYCYTCTINYLLYTIVSTQLLIVRDRFKSSYIHYTYSWTDVADISMHSPLTFVTWLEFKVITNCRINKSVHCNYLYIVIAISLINVLFFASNLKRMVMNNMRGGWGFCLFLYSIAFRTYIAFTHPSYSNQIQNNGLVYSEKETYVQCRHIGINCSSKGCVASLQSMSPKYNTSLHIGQGLSAAVNTVPQSNL